MAIGEVFLGAFLQVMFDRLASTSLIDFVNQFGEISSEQIKKWRRKLKKLERYLVNAEQRQLNETDVKKWLDDLRDFSYDLEDLLDEIETEASERRLKTEDDRSESSIMIPSFISDYFSNFKFHDCVKDITSRLDDLFERIEDLDLVKISGDTSSVAISALDRPASTSSLSEVAILGRDEDKRRMLDMVMRDDSGSSGINFQVLSIVGMGGIGKTTLAQAVYNDESLMGEFSVKAWVCISQDFDVLRISKAILEAFTFLPSDLQNLNQVQLKLREEMAGKKFLLTLDDVWNFNYELWHALEPPFMAAAPGSKIIVTTRNRDVAKIMGSIESIELTCLSDHDCWKLFCRHVKLDTLNGNLDSIRDKVVKRCKGLPLAAKALGGLLICKHSKKWEDILDSEIWNLPSNKCNILPVLRLSYQHLPSHLKRCFAYCAILPEDYEFEEQELVLLWMAEGFIHESNEQMEDLGREYFADLVSRSFFQQSRSGRSKYIMHDLVNDLAKWASGDTCFRLEDKVKSKLQGEKIKNTRHASFIPKYHDGKNRFEVFHEAIRLRTFLPFSTRRGCHISDKVVFDLLPKLKRLRALSLEGYYVIELPDSIGDLKHMRYFNLAGTMIKSIPESISRLLNLQTLILRNCSKLLTLPSGLGELINLHYLDIKGANFISEMPLGMDNLKSLRTLSNFVVGKGACSSLKVLKNLKLHNEEFRISGLENADNVKDVQLNKMEGLKVLELEWNSCDRSRHEEVDKKALDVLQPHTKLEELTIKSYHGRSFSSWVGDSLFTNMKALVLNDCVNCTSLPSLGQLCSLKQLIINKMQNLKSIGSHVCGVVLEILHLHSLPKCEVWEPIQENEHARNFTRLRDLSIRDCTKISGKLPLNLPSLRQLDIKNCPELVVSVLNLSIICDLKIDGCKKVVCRCPLDSKPLECLTLSSISEVENCLLHGIQKVHLLEIKGTNCEQVIDFWQRNEPDVQNPSQGLQAPMSVSELCINGNCPNLVSIPEVRFLPTLTKLEIKGCKDLTSLAAVLKHNLESLKVEDCDSLKCIARGTVSRCLRRLTIWRCKSLLYVFDDGEAGSTSTLQSNTAMPVLEYLCVGHCESLMCLSSSGLLAAELKHIMIRSCSELITLSSALPKELQDLEIYDCRKLESIAESLCVNTSLEMITINSCDNLQSIPDDLHDKCSLRSISIS